MANSWAMSHPQCHSVTNRIVPLGCCRQPVQLLSNSCLPFLQTLCMGPFPDGYARQIRVNLHPEVERSKKFCKQECSKTKIAPPPLCSSSLRSRACAKGRLGRASAGCRTPSSILFKDDSVGKEASPQSSCSPPPPTNTHLTPYLTTTTPPTQPSPSSLPNLGALTPPPPCATPLLTQSPIPAIHHSKLKLH